MYAGVGKTAVDGDDLSLVPDGAGRIQVVGNIPADYFRLIVVPADKSSGRLAVTPGGVWNAENSGMSFTRTYQDGSVEFAGGFVGDGSTGTFGSEVVLATIGGGQGIPYTVSYSLRHAGERDIRSGSISIEAKRTHEAVNPTAVILYQNVPNPFNPTTTIEFTLPGNSPVRLVVYSVSGQQVVELVNGIMDAGMHSVTWNAGSMPSGMYFYVLESAGFKETRKMLLMK